MITWPSVEPEVRHVLPDVEQFIVKNYLVVGRWITWEGYVVDVFTIGDHWYVKNQKTTWTLFSNGYFDNGTQRLRELV